MKVERVIVVVDGKQYELKKDVSCFRCALRVDCSLKGIPHCDGGLMPCDCQFYGYRRIKEAMNE